MNIKRIWTTQQRLLRDTRGMTLVEIMVVLVIIGMIMGMVGIYAAKQLDEAKVENTKSQMAAVVQALDMYKVKFGSYPSTEQGLQELVSKGIMKSLPKDEWENEFEYIRNSSNSFTLKSYGADKQAGGDGIDKDLISEQ